MANIKGINYDQFEQLCKIQCTQAEICGVLGVTDKTLNLRLQDKYGCQFSEAYKQFAEFGKASIRRMQFKLAERNTAMAIWLGKQYLGQRDQYIPDKDSWMERELQLMTREEEVKAKENAQAYLNGS